jgi:hypothetical protein
LILNKYVNSISAPAHLHPVILCRDMAYHCFSGPAEGRAADAHATSQDGRHTLSVQDVCLSSEGDQGRGLGSAAGRCYRGSEKG